MASPAAILRASKAVPGGAVATAPPQGVPGWTGSTSPLARELTAPGSYRNAYGPFLPRPPQDFTQGAFGPFSPILPVPVDAPGDNGRAAPRREQYETGWNLPTGIPGSEGIGKLASFQTLRVISDLYSVARACIQLRKSEIRGIEWDIVPTKDAAKAMRNSPSQMRDFGERRGKALAFFRRPDPDYFSWASFIDDALEQMLVFDALSVFLAPKRGKGMGKGLLGSDLDCLQLIDGQTIRPLYDLHGAAPRPPAPALQQYLFGVPRSDFTTMVSGRDIEDGGLKGAEARPWRGDQLLYLPYTRRRWSPYGMAAVERALIPIMSGLQKQGWQLDYFRQGTVPAVYVSPGDTSMTPNQIRELQDALNAIAGDPAWHHKIIVLPPGSKTMPQRDTQLADQFDEIVRVDTCMAFDVEPMELGISPRVSTTQSSGAANQMAKMAQQKVDRKSTGPLLRFLASICDHILRDLCHQDDMRFLFDGLEEEEDEATETGMVVQQVSSALRSIDEGREKLGLQPWGMKETQDPILITATGPVPLQAALQQAANPPAPALPPGVAPAAAPDEEDDGDGGNEGQSPGHDAAEAAQDAQEDDATGGGPAPKAAVAAELDALARHLRKGRRISTWQPRHLPAHALAAISEDLAKGLTADEAVGVTRAMLLKAAPQPPAGEPQDAASWPGWELDLALAGVYTDRITAAFSDAVKAAAGYLRDFWSGALTVTRDALAGMIRSAVARSVGAVLGDLWRESWHLGARSAEAVATLSVPDWGGWVPGDTDAAALVSDEAGLRRLLAGHGVNVIQSVSETGMDDLARAISEAVADGDSAESLARRLPGILRVPQRAGMIARTEIARAVSAATTDTYRDMGVSRREWLVAPDDRVCVTCRANEAAGAVPLDQPFPSGDPNPPAHPSCRCATVPAEVSGVDLTDLDGGDFEYKYVRVTDLNGQVTWRDSRDDDDGGYAAGGGGMMPRPHGPDGTQYRPGGVPGSTAGGEPPRWDGSEPEPRVASAPDDGDDAAYPPQRGIPPRPGEDWPAPYMDGYWPQGGHGTGQAGMSSPGGGERGRPPNGVGKGASDPSDPNPVEAEHVKSLMLANFPPKALGWVDDASWIGPVEVPQDRIDTDDEESWAASHEGKAVKRFAKAIKAGTGHTHPVILVQSPGNPRAVVIDGHHRTLAYRKLGRPVRAYVGQVAEVTPEILETHSYQQHQGAEPGNKAARLLKASVGYRPAAGDRRCGTCVMFRPGEGDGRCTLVQGPIEADHVCDRWERQTMKAAVPGLASRSGMISLDIPDGVIGPLPGGLTDFHVTVVYLGPDVDDDAFALACERARAAGAQAPGPLAAMLTGIGSFPPSGSSDGKVPVFIPARIPGAELLRAELEDLSASEHKDWKPHVTLAYLDEGEPLPEPGEPKAVTLTHLSVHRGDDVERFPLGGAAKAAHGEHDGNAERLREYWAHGEGAAKIRWGEPGDFDRCVLHVGKFMADPKGYCAERHHEALGIWPATHARMEREG